MSIRTLSITLLLTALALAACGSSSNNKKSPKAQASDPAVVTGANADAVKNAATTVITDAVRSCNLLTPKAISTFTDGGSGIKGVKKCKRQAAAGNFPATAKVVVLKLQGMNASVGYSTDAVTGAMQLVKIHGQWLMDSATTIPAP